MGHEVFICHSSQDRLVAKAVCDALEAAHVRCWIAPRNIAPGMNWNAAIAKAIDDCRIAVVILSTHSNKSDHVLREINIAVSRKIIIIPFRIEEIALSNDLRYLFAASQWFDAFPPPVDRHARRLAEYLRKLLKRPKPTPDEIDLPPPPEHTSPNGRPWTAVALSLALVSVLTAITAVACWPQLSRLFVGRLPAPSPSATLENPVPGGKDLQALTEKAGPATKSVPVKPEPPARKTIKQQFEEIKSDFQTQVGQRAEESRPLLLRESKASERIKNLIKENSTAPEVSDALLWAVINDCGDPSAIPIDPSSGFDKLRASDFRTRDLTWLESDSWALEPFLRAILDKHPDQELKAIACLALGRRFKERISKEDSDGQSVGDYQRSLRIEAETFLSRAISDFGSVHISSGSIAKLAGAEIYELKNLAVGQPAPEISEPDSQGRPLRWNDLKGKVVVIFFSRNISSKGASLALDRWLRDHFANQPLELLTVNGDPEAGSLRPDLQRQKDGWRIWKDGRSIADRWNVCRWPTIYVIDHEGIIRDRFKGDKATHGADVETIIAKLVQGVPPPPVKVTVVEPPKALPPRITIVHPESDFQVRQITDRINLEVVATPRDREPVTSMEILVNGQLIPDTGRGIRNEWSEASQKWTRRQSISLREGINTIAAVAKNRQSTSDKIVITGTYIAKYFRPLPDPARPIEKAYLGLIAEPTMAFLKTGVWLQTVHNDSPAQKAGIKGKDILFRFNEREIRTWPDYKAALEQCRPGQSVQVEVRRSGNPTFFTITLGVGKED